MNWYQQAKLKEYFNIQGDLDIKTAGILSNIWEGIKSLFASAGNLLVGVFEAALSPLATIGSLTLYSILPFTWLLDEGNHIEDVDIRSLDYMHCKGVMSIVCAIANIVRGVYHGVRGIVKLGLAAGETALVISKKINGLLNKSKIDKTVDHAVKDYIIKENVNPDEAKKVKEQTDKSKDSLTKGLRGWLKRVSYEIESLFEGISRGHIVSLVKPYGVRYFGEGTDSMVYHPGTKIPVKSTT